MKRYRLKPSLAVPAFAVAMALGAISPLHAEDVDIFTKGSGAGNKPNVLLVLDNSSNWSSTLGPNSCQKAVNGIADDPAVSAASTKFAAEVCALTKVVKVVPDSIRFGMMMFSESGDNGAYLRYGIRDMTDLNKLAFTKMLAGFVSSGSGTDNSGSNQPYAKAMYEAFKYFGGYTSPALANSDTPGSPLGKTAFGTTAFAGGSANSSGTFRRDYVGNTGNRAAFEYGAEPAGSAFLAKTSDVYDIPPIKDNCAKNFVIFISNGNPSTGGDSSTNPARDTALLASVGATSQAIPSAATETHASKMDEFALFLNQTDVSPLLGRQRVITYTIAVYQPQVIEYTDTVTGAKGTTPCATCVISKEVISNTDQQMIKLMKSAASVGGGKYYAGRSADAIVAALLDILTEVQSVNSAFVSASLPVSVNNQGTFLNQVYMGMFRPDPKASPRWLGNLKQYKFKLDASTGAVTLADSLNNDAVSSAGGGFIKPTAVSFWTVGGTNPAGTGWPAKNFWANSQSGTPLSASDLPDGDIIEKGGAAEMQRIDYAQSQGPRKMLTCPPAGCSGGSTPDEFSTTTITGGTYESLFGLAGVSAASDLKLLVNWIRGEDNFWGNAPCNPADLTLCPTGWGSAEGGPGWPATVRPSIHGDVLHSRPVVINYNKAPVCLSPNGCPYVFYGANDGTLRAIKGGQQSGTGAVDGHELWSFVAPEFYSRFKRLRAETPKLRTPDTEPILFPTTAPKDYFFDGPIGSYEAPDGVTKWIFVAARRGGRVIYAFDVSDPANPKFMWKKNGGSGADDLKFLGQSWSLPQPLVVGGGDPVLVFGAGYDVGEDTIPVVNNGLGRGIYVLDAKTGKELAFINQTYDTSQKIDSPIASDIGFVVSSAGTVTRGYVGDLAGNVWRLDMGTDPDPKNWRLFKFAVLGATHKFFYAPDIVHAGGYDSILIGSGDREKPLVKTSVDGFYALNDKKAAAGMADAIAPLTAASLQLLTSDTGLLSVCAPDACMGWYRVLADGEKVVNSPLTVAGVTYFSTNMPDTRPPDTSCSANLGIATAYGITFATGGKPADRSQMGIVLDGGGLPPSPVGGVVDIGDGQLVTFIIGSGDNPSKSALESGRIKLSIPKTRTKIYWSSKIDA